MGILTYFAQTGKKGKQKGANKGKPRGKQPNPEGSQLLMGGKKKVRARSFGDHRGPGKKGVCA